MTQKDVLDYLIKKGFLYKVIEDENNEGELVITGIQFNDIKSIIKDLKKKQKDQDSLIFELKKKIKSNEGGVCFEKLDREYLDKRQIVFEKDCYILDSENIVISNCYISLSNPKVGMNILGHKK